MALPDRHAGVVRIIECLRNLPEPRRQRLAVGGYAVKTGLTAPIAGSEMVPDISALGFD